MKEILQFIEYLKKEKEDCLKEAEALANDNRKDESNLVKIRSNMFEIVISISKVAEQRFPQNTISYIKEKISKIATSWEESLAMAELHNDHMKIMYGRIKLDAMAQISETLEQIIGGVCDNER